VTGLLAKAVCQAMDLSQTHRLRGQARSYSGSRQATNFVEDTESVGAGLLANAVCQSPLQRLEGAFASKPAPTEL